MTLEDLIQKLTKEYRVEGGSDVHEDWKDVNVFLTQAIQNHSKAVIRPLGRVLKNNTVDGQVELGPRAKPDEGTDGEDRDAAQIVVLASGNLGLIYSTVLDKQATIEGMEELYPGLLSNLVQHEGIGFAMMRSKEQGAVVIGDKGRYYLANDRVEGENPLIAFGPNTADHLRRTDSFPDAPDILINSFYDSETNEVAAYEELIGSHGGLGGYQTQPFVLFPAEWELEDNELVGAAAVYRQFKIWLGQL